MLDALKLLWPRKRVRAQWSDIEAWAGTHGHRFRRSRDDSGFVVEGAIAGRSWRLEWGPSQRDYIVGHELRLRMEIGLPQAMQLLVLSRPLMLALERETFERYTDGTQTKIDTATPEEMRWLAMFQQFAFPSSSVLRAHVGAVGSSRSALAAWLEGALSEQIVAAATGVLAYPTPFVLMTIRGRASLRIGLPAIDSQALAQALALFAVAASRAVNVADTAAGVASTWPTTSAAAWRSTPGDDAADSLG